MAATHRQADRYLHQCFIVGLNEPYIEVCTRLAELSPLPSSWLRASRRTSCRGSATSATGTELLYVDDVVQSGLGWIGRVWAIEH